MMRLSDPLAAAVTLGVILCCVQAPARTWTDSTGKHKIERGICQTGRRPSGYSPR